MRKRIKSRLGTTLVELLVTFALFSIFMTAAAAVITPCTRIFLKTKYMTYAQNVSDMVMDRVAGEITDASERVKIDTDTGGKRISLSDGFSSPLYIEAKNGYLNIRYREVREVKDNIVYEDVLWPAADWHYDEKAYQGFKIETLQFLKSAGNCVEIKLKLYSESRDITYETSKTVECYTLISGETVEEGPVYVSDDDYYDNYFVKP